MTVRLKFLISISIHALREEGDQTRPTRSMQSVHFYPRPPRGGRHETFARMCNTMQFLSTPSARRATLQDMQIAYLTKAISIHALREEGDQSKPMRGGTRLYFYPRPPRGGRLLS